MSAGVALGSVPLGLADGADAFDDGTGVMLDDGVLLGDAPDEYVDVVLPVGSHGSRALVEAYCEEAGIHLDPRLRLDSLNMTKAVLADGRTEAFFKANLG